MSPVVKHVTHVFWQFPVRKLLRLMCSVAAAQSALLLISCGNPHKCNPTQIFFFKKKAQTINLYIDNWLMVKAVSTIMRDDGLLVSCWQGIVTSQLANSDWCAPIGIVTCLLVITCLSVLMVIADCQFVCGRVSGNPLMVSGEVVCCLLIATVSGVSWSLSYRHC